MVLDAESGAHVVTIKVCSSALTAVRFSPGGDTVALAAQSGAVYLYRAEREGRRYKKWGKMAGKSDALAHLDWNKNGDLLQTVGAEYDVAYWNVNTSRVSAITFWLEER